MTSDDGGHDLADAALEVAVVGDGGAEGDFGGGLRGDAAGHELRGVDEQARRDALFEPVAAEVAHLLADEHEVARRVERDAALARDYLGFKLRGRVVELQSDEALARGLLEVFEDGLVAGVVADD